MLLATGPAVDALINSGVASYLEFKDMQALYLASDIAAPTSSAAGVGGARAPAGSNAAAAAGGGRDGGRRDTNGSSSSSGNSAGDSSSQPHHRLGLSRVPCSKADVFGTKLLTPLEKRRLMKFLLFASDWGLQRRGEDVLSRNEAGLGRGRSLRRPQNREAASGDFDADAHAGKPFSGFLRGCGLPERVRAMITHALALLPGGDEGGDGGGVTTEEGLEAVYRWALGFGGCGVVVSICSILGHKEWRS